MSVPFVGRGPELATLVALSRRSLAERAPAAALVTGDPGSGKTRLLTETLRRVRGIRTVRAVGFEPIQPIPFAAVDALLRCLATVPGSGQTLEDLLFGGDQTARDPLRVFEVAHRALARSGPLLLVIDDLQWVDQLSLGLVHYLMRAAESGRQPLAVIAVTRPSPAAASFRSGLEAAIPVERRALIELGPLALADGMSLVRAIDDALDETSAAELWRRTGGWPFWLEAVARARRNGDASALVEERLRSLTADAAALLAALAVSGRPLPAEDLAAVLQWEPERVRHAAAELVSRGLGVEATGTIRLAHDLIRESALRGLPAPARRRMEAAVARWIEASAGDDLQLLCEALEHRVAGGQPSGDLAARVVASPRRRLLDGDNVRTLAAIADGLDPATPESLDLDGGLGQLAADLGEQELALTRWLRVGEHAPDASVRQRAEMEAARAAYRLGRADEAHRHLDRAQAVAPSTPETAVRLDALQAEVELWLDHATDTGSRTAARALATAREIAAAAGGIERLPATTRRACLEALEAAADAAMQQERADDVMRLGEASVVVAAGLDEESYVAALLRTGFGLRPIGRIREAEERYRRAWEVAERLFLPTAMVDAGHGLARCLRDLGRLAEAHAVAAATAELETRLRTAPRRWGNALSILHAIELALGEPAVALSQLRADAAAEPDPHYRLTIHQAIAAWQARFAGPPAAAEVEKELAAARSASELAGCPRCAAELTVVSAELLARIGRPDAARRELAVWDRPSVASYPMRELWRSRASALVAVAEGDLAAAVPALEALADTLARQGLLEDLVWARLDLGRALASADRVRAREAFAGAAAVAAQIGAVSQDRLAARELRRLGVRAWRRGPATAGEGVEMLSGREREVAGLVAQGWSNREIADSLLVSPKTVERHLTNVLAKLGLRNRTELAARIRAGGGTGFSR